MKLNMISQYLYIVNDALIVYKGMLDLIIISYKLTTNVSVTYYRIQQYPVKYIYNSRMAQTWWLRKLVDLDRDGILHPIQNLEMRCKIGNMGNKLL